MKKKSIYGLVVCFLSIILIILAWNYRQKNKPIVLEFGMFAESNWDVKNANAYVIIDDAIKKFEKEHPGVKVHYETGIRKEDYSEWLDRKILEALIYTYQGRAVGIDTIAVTIGEEPETIEDVYEPYLVQVGFISRTPKGRIALPAAYEHLGVKYGE